MTRINASASLADVNILRCVSVSQSTTPTAQMSDCRVTSVPLTCSGDM